MKTVAIYVRVSTQEQASEGYSIQEQTERLTKYCEAHGWTIANIYTDPGYSGGNLDRPAIQKLFKDLKRGYFDTVLVYKLDRLSRSQKDTMFIIEDEFMKNGIDFISMNENFDTGTPFGRAMIGILSVFAQLEKEQIKERLMMGRIGRAKTGRWNGGQKPPVGYDYKDGELQVIEYEAMQIRLIFDLFLNGLDGEELSLHQIKDYMGSRYETRYSAWRQAACISRILNNRIYIGEIKYGGEWYPGAHKAIISHEIWDAAQTKYHTYMKKFAKSQQHPFEGRYLLSGLLWCGTCGARYYMTQSQRKNKQGEMIRHKYYRCYTANGIKSMGASTPCKSKGWPREKLDKIIIDEICKLALDPGKVRELHRKSIPELADAGTVIQERIQEIERQIDKLLDLYQLGTIGIDKITARVEVLSLEKEKLQNEMGTQKVPRPNLDPEEALEVLSTAAFIFENGTPEEQQSLVRSLINKIVVLPESLEIHWAFCVS